MGSLKHISLFALTFGFILASSFANAGRVTDGFVPHDPLADCHMLDYVCNNRNDCFGPCGKEYYPPKDCVALPTDPSGPHHCCCHPHWIMS
ncbi:hypothetical protein MKW98_032212 [Papaver atlanticum]|uniref:Uncharacterized protein n=1 Tax=Papaver atlanticum TaxID=357466 RepID=A0AAD4XE87_9MAGN|nr:hypothetical protein MKW98_032212 [Papaver atlanticum]